MPKGIMYILECVDGSYYTGSTKDLDRRLIEHENMRGANYTKKRLPIKLIYFEEYDRIDYAFNREKQVQGWRREKKEALINGKPELLPALAKKIFRGRKVASVNPPTAVTQPPDGEIVDLSVASRTSATDEKLRKQKYASKNLRY